MKSQYRFYKDWGIPNTLTIEPKDKKDKYIPCVTITPNYNFVTSNEKTLVLPFKTVESIFFDNGLDSYYDKFKITVTSKDPLTILSAVAEFIKKHLTYNKKEVMSLYDSLIIYTPWGKFREEKISPPIPLSIFLDFGYGVCRHFALIAISLLSKYANENKLDASVYLCEQISQQGSHIWVAYKHKNENYMIDYSNIYSLNLPENIPKLQAKYGIDAVKEMLDVLGMSLPLPLSPPTDASPASDDAKPLDQPVPKDDMSQRNNLNDQLKNAVVRSDGSDVAKLLKKGANPNFCIKNQLYNGSSTPLLTIASGCMDLKIMSLLMDAGADINQTSGAPDQTQTALTYLRHWKPSGYSDRFNKAEELLLREAERIKKKEELISYLDKQIARKNISLSKKNELKTIQLKLQPKKKVSLDDNSFTNAIRRCVSDHTDKGVKGFFKGTWIRKTRSEKDFNKIFDATNTLKKKPH